MIVPIQPYNSAAGGIPDITATSCDDKGFFTAADLRPDSDILVIRHASTELFAGTDESGSNAVTDTTVDGTVYIQSNVRTAEIKIADAANAVDPSTSSADVKGDTDANRINKFPGKATLPYADIREYNVHIYYVAQCNAAAVCTTSDTPTLKRLELTNDGSGGTEMAVIPLVEGVERFNVEFGIDNNPATANAVTGQIGDGVPDTYVAIPATVADYENIMSIKVHLLVRSLESTVGYEDDKVYTVGSTGAATDTIDYSAINNAFKRNVYRFEVRPSNVAAKREIP